MIILSVLGASIRIGPCVGFTKVAVDWVHEKVVDARGTGSRDGIVWAREKDEFAKEYFASLSARTLQRKIEAPSSRTHTIPHP